MMGEQVMMETGRLSAPNATVAVRSFLMDGVGETFADKAPLESEVAVIVESGAFVRTPTHGTMVNDDVLVSFRSVHGVVTFLLDVYSHS